MAQIIYNSAFILDTINEHSGQQKLPVQPEELINYSCREDTLHNLVIVVPTGKLVKRLKQSAIRKYFEIHQRPVQELNFFTLSKFIEFSYDKIFNDRKKYQVSEAYSLSLIEEASQTAGLQFFSNEDRKLSPVLLERLSNVIFGLKEDGVTVEMLKEDLALGEHSELAFFDSPRLLDVIKLYEKYEELLQEKYLDFPEILKKIYYYLLVNRNSDLFRDRILEGKSFILFHGFSEFKKPEVDFISLFARTKIAFALHIDYSTNNGPLFGNLDENITSLINKGLNISSPDDMIENYNIKLFENEDFQNESNLSRELYLRRWLFNTRTNITNKGFNDIIKIIEAEDRYHEVIYCAKLVKYLIIKENIKPFELCISMRQAEIYTGLFREIFASYKIPVNISDRFDLSSSSVIISIFSLLNIINKGYKLQDVHKALLSSYLKIGESDFDAENLIDKAQKFRIFGGFIRGGSKYWIRILESRLISINSRLTALELSHNSDPLEYGKISYEKKRIKKALDDFRTLNKLLPVKQNKYSPEDFKNILLNNIISNFKIKENIISILDNYLYLKDSLNEPEKIIYMEVIEKDAKALNAFTELLEEMTFILSDRFPNQTFSLNDLITKLKTIVSGQKYQIKEKQNFGVNITSIEQTRGIPFKVMILCGAVDGEFPMSYRPETFLGKELKISLDKHIQSERLQFYQFLTNDIESLNKSEKQIYIFYPQNNESEELVRSSFVDALLKITSIEEAGKVYNIPNIKNFINSKNPGIKGSLNLQLNELPWLDSIANENELYKSVGKITSESSTKINETILLKDINFTQQQKITLGYIDSFFAGSNINNGKINFEILPDDLALELKNFKNRPVSITDLESYVNCPFKFFVKKLLKIDEPHEHELSLSSLDKGQLLHEIVYKFYTAYQTKIQDENDYEYIFKSLKNEFIDIIPVTLKSNLRKTYLSDILHIAEKELEYLKFEHPFFKLDEESITGTEGRPGLLEMWLDAELKRSNTGWGFKPVLFEFPFGIHTSKYQDLNIDPVDIGGMLIKGKIDRIELLVDGPAFKIIIADYKTTMSNVPGNKSIKDGKSFQMPLYMIAAKKILSEYYNIDAEISGGVYYGFIPEKDKITNQTAFHKFSLLPVESPLYSSENSKKTKQVLNKNESLELILEQSLDYAKKIIDKISEGLFPVEPQPSACKYCNFFTICRIKERKMVDNSDEDN